MLLMSTFDNKKLAPVGDLVLRSTFLPRFIGALMVLAGFGWLTCLTTMVVPRVYEVLGMSYMMPMFVYEVGLGVWLLIKGLKEPPAEATITSR